MRDIRERTLDFALRIIRLCQQLDEQPGVGRTLGWQLLRSGTSIGANVEEAQAGQSKPDFISKNAIALKEARAKPSTGFVCLALHKLFLFRVLPSFRLKPMSLQKSSAR